MTARATLTGRRILLVTKGLDFGGIERVVVDLTVGMRRRGITVDVALVNDRRDDLLASVEEVATVHRLGGDDRIGWRAARALREVAAGYDLVHAHGPLASAVTRLVVAGAPVVSTSHTDWASLRRITRLAWAATMARDAGSIAVSASVVASLPRHLRGSMQVIPHGVDVARTAALSGTSRSSEQQACRAITVASHRDVKNYPNLLRALRHAVDLGAPIRLEAVGVGNDRPHHVQLAAELGLSEAVEFSDPSENILERIADADMLVVASDFEGQPMVVAEALAVGTPVVATAVGRVPEMIDPRVGRVVRPRAPEELGAAIAELAFDRQLRHTLGEEARRRAPRWTLDDAIDAHVGLYSRLVDAGRGSATA